MAQKIYKVSIVHQFDHQFEKLKQNLAYFWDELILWKIDIGHAYVQKSRVSY